MATVESTGSSGIDTGNGNSLDVGVIKQASSQLWHAYNCDCVEGIKGLPSESIGLTVFSPPYGNLYVYSDSPRDMGNCLTDSEFYSHFGFLLSELYRVTIPGRIIAVDCMNIPAMKGKDGYIGLKDFRGDLIWFFQKQGFIFHSEHCIWKDPLIEATRTKALGLMHKQLIKDSSMSRAGIPQYLLAFRKPGANPFPINHPQGMDEFVGEDPPNEGNLSHERWRRYASPVWMDINPSRTLNFRAARDEKDEKHLCPMSLDIIDRAIWLWSKKTEVVLDPFSGVFSTGYCAIVAERRFIGFELKPSYFNAGLSNMRAAEEASKEGKLF